VALAAEQKIHRLLAGDSLVPSVVHIASINIDPSCPALQAIIDWSIDALKPTDHANNELNELQVFTK
jgi:hypothetical protein